MNDIRLLIINDFPLIGGAEHVILSLCRYLRARPDTAEWKLHLVTSRTGAFSDTAAEIPACQVYFIDIYGLKKQWLNPVAWHNVQKSLDNLSTTVQPNAVLCNSAWSAAVVNRFFYKRNIPVIGAIHADISPRLPAKKKVFSVAGKQIMRHINQWITVSEPLARQIESVKIKNAKIQVIPNGVVISESSVVVRNGPWRRKRNIAPDAIVVLVAGRLDPGKGQHTVIEALLPLMGEGLDIHLLISGEEMPAKVSGSAMQGSYTKILQKMIVVSGMEKRIFLTGYVDNISDLICECDIVASASREESFGLSVLEGMAAGRTVIASDIDAHRSLVENNETGLLFDPENTDSFSAVLRRAISDKTLRAHLGTAARQHARRYDSEKSFQKWVECIQSTVSEYEAKDDAHHGETG